MLSKYQPGSHELTLTDSNSLVDGLRTNFTNKDLFDFLDANPEIISLHIQFQFNTVSNDFCKRIKFNRTLQTLRFSNTHIHYKDNDISSLFDALSENKTLRHLYLGNACVNNNVLNHALSALKKNQNIRSIHFDTHHENHALIESVLKANNKNRHQTILSLFQFYLFVYNTRSGHQAFRDVLYLIFDRYIKYDFSTQILFDDLADRIKFHRTFDEHNKAKLSVEELNFVGLFGKHNRLIDKPTFPPKLTTCMLIMRDLSVRIKKNLIPHAKKRTVKNKMISLSYAATNIIYLDDNYHNNYQRLTALLLLLDKCKHEIMIEFNASTANVFIKEINSMIALAEKKINIKLDLLKENESLILGKNQSRR